MTCSCSHTPYVLCALTPAMAARAGLACCDCAAYVPPCRNRILSCNAAVVQPMRAEADALRETIREQQNDVMRLHDVIREERNRADAAEGTLRALQTRLDEALTTSKRKA